MKKAALFLFGIMSILMTSCTLEDQEIKNKNSIIKNNEIQQYSDEVDPGTVKPPTHG
jgi:hypothetical protein